VQFAPFIVDSITMKHDMNVKSSNSSKKIANKDVELETKSPNHSLFHCNKKIHKRMQKKKILPNPQPHR
jgi:hypothetical protein